MEYEMTRQCLILNERRFAWVCQRSPKRLACLLMSFFIGSCQQPAGPAHGSLTLTSADQFEGSLGKVVAVQGTAENIKEGAYLAAGFYGFEIARVYSWPRDVLGKTIVVTGMLKKRPGYAVPVTANGQQHFGDAGSTIPPEYILTDIEWVLK